MKFYSLLIVALAALLSGCAEEGPEITYQQPLISPGGQFAALPPAVQNSVRAQAGSAEIAGISRSTNGDARIYEVRFTDTLMYPPLFLTSDGSVLAPDLTVAVGASEDTIEVSTASAASGVKLDELPPNVVRTIHSQAPTAEVDTINRLTSGSDVFYDVFFKDPQHHPALLISDDGRLAR